MLYKACGGDISKWWWFLPHVLWADRISIRKHLGCSPFFMVTGAHPTIPLDVTEATWLVELPRAHHELTCGLIWTRPAGFFFSKSLIQIHTDKFPQVICLCGSGTCIPWITCSIQVPASICRYSQVLADISYHLINCLHIFEILYEHLHSFFVANITTI